MSVRCRNADVVKRHLAEYLGEVSVSGSLYVLYIRNSLYWAQLGEAVFLGCSGELEAFPRIAYEADEDRWGRGLHLIPGLLLSKWR
jgi:hypothetical protein